MPCATRWMLREAASCNSPPFTTSVRASVRLAEVGAIHRAAGATQDEVGHLRDGEVAGLTISEEPVEATIHCGHPI